MNLLVVEDDFPLAQFMKKALRAEGLDASLAHTGAEALRILANQRFELLVLDLGLPEVDGVDVLKEVRRIDEGLPVIVVTGRAGLEERVRCLELGADDVLVKPFALSELMARTRAVQRRTSRPSNAVLRFADLELDRVERTVHRDSTVVELTVKEFALLECLMQNGGRCTPRSALLEKVWQLPPNAASNVVDVYINYLRRKLDAAPGLAWVETLRGQGYKLSALPATLSSIPQSALGVSA